MIVRSALRCSATRRLQVCRPRLLHVELRKYSTSTLSAANSPGSSPASILGAFENELDKIAPRFEIHGSRIQILRSPSEFYETLKVGMDSTCLCGQKLMGVDQDIERGETDILVNVVHRQNRA